MTLKEVLDRSTQFLKDKKSDSPRLDAELLLASGLGLQRIDLYLRFDKPLSEDELVRCRELVRRRSQGEPVAYILGEKNFFGHAFLVNSSVLIPRPETELLVSEALSWIKKNNQTDGDIQILDLGTGSGCLGLSLLQAFPRAQGVLVDSSAGAVAVAQSNARKLKVDNRARIICQGVEDLGFSEGQFDLIIANPPYIADADPHVQAEVRQYEPAEALFAGVDGLHFIEHWARRARSWLKKPGWMGFEIGYDQGHRVLELFSQLGFEEVVLKKDLSGQDRHILGWI